MFTPKEFLEYQKKQGMKVKIKPPKGMILCFNRNLMKYISENHEIEKEGFFGGDLYVLKETKNNIGVIGNFGIGAPSAVAFLEELIAFGVTKFVVIGTSGALQKDLQPGSIILCSKAIRDEGTSHHYLKKSKYAYPSKNLKSNIKKILDGSGKKYFEGVSWTIDAPYRETVVEARKYQGEGVLTVEMEASALFSVAKYRGVEIAAVFTISDSLAELEWQPNFDSEETRKTLEFLYYTALKALQNK